MRDLADLCGLVATGALPVLAWTALGLAPVRRLGLARDRVEAAALAYVFGSGAASLAILVLRLLDVPVPLWAVAALLLACAPAVRTWLREPPGRRPPGRGWVRAVEAGAAIAAVLTFGAALGPETYWDGFEYHLPMVAAWSDGPIRALPGMLDAELRAGVDLLYLPAVAAGRPDAAAAVSAGFALALAGLVRAEARERATPGAAAVATLFALLVPFTRDNAPSSYVDLGVGAYGAVALLCADRWNRGADRRALLAAAVALAFAANAKLHAAVLGPAVALLLLFGGRRPPLADLARGAAIVAVLCAPWLVKSWLTTGNPLFPLLGAWLGTGAADPAHLALRRARLAGDWPGPRGPTGLLRYLASLALGHNPHLSGLLGALPFALLPAAIHRPSRPTAVLVLTLAALFALQFAFMPALRFGSPLLPFVAVGTAVGGARLAASAPFAARAVAAAVALLAVHHAAALAADYGPRLLALRDPDAYRARVFPGQVALAELVAHGRGVVAIPKGAVLWMPRPVYVLHWERNGELFFDAVRGHRTPPGDALSLLRQRGVETVILERPEGAVPPGRTGHPTADAWIAAGLAERAGGPPRAARPGFVYVRVDLRPPAA